MIVGDWNIGRFRRFRVLQSMLTALTLALCAQSASALDYPEEYVKRPQVLRERMLQVRGDVLFGLTNGFVAKPIIIAPSVEYGVSDEFQVALRHENSFCFNKCDFYNGFGLEAKYLFFHKDTASVSAFGGPYVNAFDPFLLQTRVGIGFWTIAGEQFALNGNVYFGLGITNREVSVGPISITTNPDVLVLNLQPAFNVSPQLALFADTGLYSSLQRFGDAWAIPFGVGALYTLDKKLDLGGDFKFPRLRYRFEL
jgi:hypothetical protein